MSLTLAAPPGRENDGQEKNSAKSSKFTFRNPFKSKKKGKASGEAGDKEDILASYVGNNLTAPALSNK
ncbi:hypothetical protein QFC21_000446 [Naganishia friedmannii]|uniref:Uncharacterized protein n=1 Tax=Naganishia friedmannii TaxID=89922 RepID=A0ACC2WBI8_9TREE|nr:hypothetical protein QFC21_000446 [Naganishia friedmannii]